MQKAQKPVDYIHKYIPKIKLTLDVLITKLFEIYPNKI